MRGLGPFGIPTSTPAELCGCGDHRTRHDRSGEETVTKVLVEMPTYLCARLDRLAAERHLNRDQLIHDLLAGVVDRETERVAAELRRIAWRRSPEASSPWARSIY
jgi:hypothetical protein